MPKNSANKQYIRVKNSSLLNDVKDSAGAVINPKNPSLPQPPISTPSPSPLAVNTFNLEYDNASFTSICAGSAPTSDYYSYDSTIGIGTVLYTDSVYPLSSFAPAGYYGDISVYLQITGATGVISLSGSCNA
jgi:hypothetical protein